MGDNPTRETTDSRSFEERVFARFDSLDARMSRFESRLDSLEAKVDSLDGRLTALEEKVDARLRETRPIWEAVLTRLDGVENRLGGVENRLGGIEKEVKEIRHGVMLLHEDNLPLRVAQRELRDRVEKLESQSTR